MPLIRRSHMRMGWGAWGCAVLLVFGDLVRAAYDDEALQYPLQNLCRRWDHQSAVLDNRLYLAGGRVLLKEHLEKNDDNNSTDPIGFNGEPSKEFIVLDLGSTFSLKKDEDDTSKWPQWEAVKYETGSEEVNLYLEAGAMWTSQEQEKIYFYEGQRTKNGTANDKSSLLSYDTTSAKLKTETSWEQEDNNKPNRFARGTGVAVPELDTGFYVGGARLFETEDGNKTWVYPAEQQFIGMDLGGNFDVNFKGLERGRKTVNAAVTYLPVGEKGILVMIDGTDEEHDREFSPRDGVDQDDTRPATSALARNEEVWIYDIASETWYIQETTGDHIPRERMGACIVGTAAPDNSSYQIYLYGGGSGSSFFGINDEEFMDDLYVLSLPSFEWFALGSDNITGTFPSARTRQTCHLINNHQMFVLGGSRNDTGTDDENSCSYDELSVLDLNTMKWLDEYSPSDDTYTVPKVITGELNTTRPEKGWTSDDLADIFSAGKKSRKLPLIIGIAAGGGAFIILVGGVALFFWRRKRRHDDWRRRFSQPAIWDAQSSMYSSRRSSTSGFGPGADYAKEVGIPPVPRLPSLPPPPGPQEVHADSLPTMPSMPDILGPAEMEGVPGRTSKRKSLPKPPKFERQSIPGPAEMEGNLFLPVYEMSANRLSTSSTTPLREDHQFHEMDMVEEEQHGAVEPNYMYR